MVVFGQSRPSGPGEREAGRARPSLPAVSRPSTPQPLNSPQFPALGRPGAARRNAQIPLTPFLLQLPCPPGTHPAQPSSASLLPASQSLHLLALCLGCPRGGEAWGRQAPRAGAPHILRGATHTLCGPHRDPKGPGHSFVQQSLTECPLCARLYARPWGTRLTRADPALAFSKSAGGGVHPGGIRGGGSLFGACLVALMLLLKLISSAKWEQEPCLVSQSLMCPGG